jgi:transcriptional regulator with XRE-family HTH domain
MRFHPENCSTLYHLEPQGIGTPWVESLSSYINRLATAHRITTVDLINRIICNEETSIIPKVDTQFYSQNASSLNGVGKYAFEFTRILQKLTLRNDIILLSMLPWRKVIDPGGKGLTTKTKQWCPFCFNDQVNNGNIVYEHLIWSLAINKTCSIHKVPLQNMCPQCFNKQPPLSRRIPVGYCSLCGHTLSEINGVDFNSKKISHWSLWAEKELQSFLSSGMLALKVATKDQFILGLNELIVHIADGNVEKLSKALGFNGATIYQWKRGRCLPRFDYLFFLCFGTGISPTLFLTNLFEACKYAHFPSNSLNTTILSPIRRINYNHDKVAAELNKIIELGEIVPLQEVACRLNAGKGYLRSRFPSQIKMITQKFQEHKLKLHRKDLEARNKKIKAAVFELHKQGIYPSQRKVGMVAYGSKYLIKYTGAKDAWNSALDELGYK